LETLAIEYWRRKVDFISRVEAADVAAPILDDMAGDAVVGIDHPPARNDLRLMIRSGHPVPLLHRALRQAGQEHDQVPDVAAVETGPRHHLLDVPGRVEARGLQFMERPLIPRLGNLRPVAER